MIKKHLHRLLLVGVVLSAFVGAGFSDAARAAAAVSKDVSSLPSVHILATGGTIAGAKQDDATEYASGVLSVDQIVASVPALASMARIEGAQISNIGSQDMHDGVWKDLAEYIAEKRRAHADTAIVITHGTDTIEETGFFLDLLFPTGAPIVLTAAMRPADHPRADGPRNLEDAFRIATDPAARDRGPLIVLNEKIHAARYVRKTHVSNVDAYGSGEMGQAGEMVEDAARFFTEPRSPSLTVDPEIIENLRFPKVGVAYMHASFDSNLIKYFSRAGYDGVVLAGVGQGNTNAATIDAMADFARKGVVVRSTRVRSGIVTRNYEINDDGLGFVVARDLSPQKAQVLLQLLLPQTDDLEVIQRAFTCDAPFATNFCAN
ncbi:MAG: asparaginase [Pseudomonadota bacterium]